MLELENPDVWSDPEHAQSLGKEKASLETVVGGLDKSGQALADASELLELAAAEEDAATVAEVEADLEQVEKNVAELEFRRMFSGELDENNAFLDIQSGEQLALNLGRDVLLYLLAVGQQFAVLFTQLVIVLAQGLNFRGHRRDIGRQSFDGISRTIRIRRRCLGYAL